MPLFGSHKKDHAATDNVHPTHGTAHPSGANTNYSNAPMSGNGAGTGTAHLSGMTPHQGHNTTSTGMPPQQGHNPMSGMTPQQGHNPMSSNDPNYAYQGGHANMHAGQPGLMNDQYGSGTHSGVNHPSGVAGGNMNTTTGSNLPPVGTLNNSDQSRGGHSTTGKIEQAVGSLVGSSALKAKGLQKEQEAAAIKLQTQEIAEAERLEREALLRRERAVAHGAHPDNAALGSSGQHGHSSGAMR